jgi:hypothetical protein
MRIARGVMNSLQGREAIYEDHPSRHDLPPKILDNGTSAENAVCKISGSHRR